MDHFEFEKRVLKHNVYYVMALLIDVLQAKVHLELVFDPSSSEPAVLLDFCRCQKFSIDFWGEEENSNYLACFLGLQNIPQASGTQYIITTEISELFFVTDVEPIVTWLDKRALELDYQPEVINMDTQSSNSQTE